MFLKIMGNRIFKNRVKYKLCSKFLVMLEKYLKGFCALKEDWEEIDQN